MISNSLRASNGACSTASTRFHSGPGAVSPLVVAIAIVGTRADDSIARNQRTALCGGVASTICASQSGASLRGEDAAP